MELDHRTDIFSLGVVFYQMATGELPFRAPHWVAVLQQILNSPTPSPKALRPHLPEAVERIVFRATAKNREERYQSMLELSSDLRSLGEAPEFAAAVTCAALAAQGEPVGAPENRHPGGGCGLAVALGAMVFRGSLGDWRVAWMLPAQRQIAVLPFINVGHESCQPALV